MDDNLDLFLGKTLSDIEIIDKDSAIFTFEDGSTMEIYAAGYFTYDATLSIRGNLKDD